MNLFLGLDIGASAVKAIIVDEADREQASAEAPLATDRPQPLWSEQHPDARWRSIGGIMQKCRVPEPWLRSKTFVKTKIHMYDIYGDIADGRIGKHAGIKV